MKTVLRFGCGRRLLADTRGQVLLLGIVTALMLLLFMLLIPGGTQVAAQKMRAQTAADAGAFSGSLWIARTLNLNANTNIGIRSMYTWMTVLTVGSALGQALYSNKEDASVEQLGKDVSLALFGNSDPDFVSANIYPQSIQRLAETGQWLYDLQTDIAESFLETAEMMGTWEATRNASGGNPLSENPAGKVRVRADEPENPDGAESILASNETGDSLMYGQLLQLAGHLEELPIDDPYIRGPARAVIMVDQSLDSFQIKAYYGDSAIVSNWGTLVQVLAGMFHIMQWYDTWPTIKPHPHTAIDSAIKFFHDHIPQEYHPWVGDSYKGQLTKWVKYGDKPHGTRRDGPGKWYAYGRHGFNVPHWVDSVIAHQRRYRFDPDTGWGPMPPPDTADEAWPWIEDGYHIVKSGVFFTDFFTGADSTGNLGARLRPRRLNPDHGFHAVAFTWHLGAGSEPRGPGPRIGGALVPRNRVAAPSPMVTVARSVPYLALENPTEENFFFSPNWEVRLTPLDSAGVQAIRSDPVFDSLGLDALNLEELRKYVLLP